MKFNTTLIIISLFTQSLISCKRKGEIIEVEKTVIKEAASQNKVNSWVEDESIILSNKVIKNAYLDNKTLYMATDFSLMKRESVKNITTILCENYGPQTQVSLFAQPINAKLHVRQINDSILMFNPNTDACNSSSWNMFKGKESDPSFHNFVSFKNCMNDQNEVLVQYYSPNNKSTRYSINFFLIHLSKEINYPERYIISSVDTIIIPAIDSYYKNSPCKLFAIDDYFLIGLGRESFKLYSNSSYKKINISQFNSIARRRNKVYLFGIGGDMLVSTDNCESFRKYTISDELPVAFSDFYTISDSIVGVYLGSNIYSLRISEDNIDYKLRFLKNDGIQGKLISGLYQIGDSVYSTTWSGLFIKPISTLFQDK